MPVTCRMVSYRWQGNLDGSKESGGGREAVERMRLDDVEARKVVVRGLAVSGVANGLCLLGWMDRR